MGYTILMLIILNFVDFNGLYSVEISYFCLHAMQGRFGKYLDSKVCPVPNIYTYNISIQPNQRCFRLFGSYYPFTKTKKPYWIFQKPDNYSCQFLLEVEKSGFGDVVTLVNSSKSLQGIARPYDAHLHVPPKLLHTIWCRQKTYKAPGQRLGD